LHPAPAVHHDQVAGDVAGAVGRQVGVEVAQFAVIAEAAQRHAAFLRLDLAARRVERFPGAFRGEQPGATQFRRMFFGPHSTARLRVMASTPALAAAEAAVKAWPVITGRDTVLMTLPAAAAFDPAPAGAMVQ
jgi:hypothetical protein